MKRPLKQGMTLRLELFVNDLSASIDFYSRILEFKPGKQQADGYTPLTNGNVFLALNLLYKLPEYAPIQVVGDERPGRGVEIVLEVSDINAIYEHVLSQNWPLSAELEKQPWGLTDFRIVDPDGYYLRISSRR